MSELVIRSARPTPVTEHLNPVALAAMLRRYWDLIYQFSAREVLERNKGAYLGVAWNLLSPLVTLVVYTFIFGYVLKVSWAARGGAAWVGVNPHVGFALTFFCGHTIFHVFSECVGRAPALISSRPNLVRKVVFPLEILPVTVVLSSLVYVAIAIGILVVAEVFVARVPPTAALFPLVLVPLVMMTLGISWFLAALGVFIRDMRQIVVVLIQVMMFMSAVFYPVERVPEPYRRLLEANPIAGIIENGRRVLLWGQEPRWVELGWITLASFVVMQLGYACFMKCRRGMADVV